MMSLLQSALILILEFFYGLTHSYELSLILLSACVSAALVPFYHLTGILEKRERIIRQRLAMYKPESHKNLRKLYEQFGYYPFYSIRSLASLFVQFPVLIAAYEALGNYAPLKNTWLGFPDAFLIGFNVLPFVMTFVNLGSVFISSEPESKERKQGIFIAMVFFVLLYESPSALLIYWIFNQLFSFIRYLIIYPLPKIKEFHAGLNFDFAYQFSLAAVIYFILTVWAGVKVQESRSDLLFDAFIAAFAALTIYKFIFGNRIYFRIPNLETVILNISVMIFPAILIFKSNEIYFVKTDLIVYAFSLLFFSIILSFLFSSKFSVSLILSIMFLPLVRDITHYSSALKISFLVLFVIILLSVSSVIRQKGIVMVFSLIASFYLLFFADSIAAVPKEKAKLYRKKVDIPEDLANLKLNDSASIYLFMHDGFAHR
ncbi:MAG: YidC/Oxa1 family membrane protein insertase, partial [Candidatus Fibromonas sp.]|nr:YidC/Oxa1 family membrane protein insertase [Candidatus Fibromonas sp.]